MSDYVFDQTRTRQGPFKSDGSPERVSLPSLVDLNIFEGRLSVSKGCPVDDVRGEHLCAPVVFVAGCDLEVSVQKDHLATHINSIV